MITTFMQQVVFHFYYAGAWFKEDKFALDTRQLISGLDTVPYDTRQVISGDDTVPHDTLQVIRVSEKVIN